MVAANSMVVVRHSTNSQKLLTLLVLTLMLFVMAAYGAEHTY